MSLINARRIAALVDEWGMTFGQLAERLGCSEEEAAASYEQAKATTIRVDAERTVRKLVELANEMGMTASDLLAAFA